MGQLNSQETQDTTKQKSKTNCPLTLLTTETKQSPDWIQRQNILSIPAMLSIGWSR